MTESSRIISYSKHFLSEEKFQVCIPISDDKVLILSYVIFKILSEGKFYTIL